MTTDTLRSAREATTTELAIKQFATHTITHRSEVDGLGRWKLNRPGTPVMWVEVIELRGGKLFIHGDIDPQIWAYGSQTRAGGLVRWMASREAPSDHYLQEKARIGMGRDLVRTFDPAIAAEDAREFVRQELDECDDNEGHPYAAPEWAERFDEACKRVARIDTSHETACDIWGEVFDTRDEWEFYPDWGMVTDAHFALAWAALVKLTELLDGEVTP